MADTPQTQPFNGLPPTIFDGDRSYSRAFLTQFRIFARINRRHTDVTYPHRRVKLALSFIHGPLVNDWKWTVYHGLAAIPTGEAWWDEFIRAFTAAWINDPVAPNESLFASRASVPMPSIRAVLGSLTPTAAATTTLADDKEDWALFAPRVASDPTPLVTPAVPRIEKRKQHDDVSDTEEIRPSKHPRIATHAGPPRARPQLGRRGVPLPRKYTYAPRRATAAPVTSTPHSLVPYSPPPRRPPNPPGDPVRAPPPTVPDPRPSAPGHTVVEGDNSPMRGVKTLDISGFDSVLAQDDATSTPRTEDSRPQTPSLTPDATDSPPQTPPRVYLFPRHALERPHDPDELTTKTIARQRRGSTRVPYPTTPRNHTRRAQNAVNRRPEDVPPTPVASRHTRKRRRANAADAPPHSTGAATTRNQATTAPADAPPTSAAAPSTSSPSEQIATRTRERCVHTARRHDRPAQVVLQPDNHNPRRTETETDRANAAVENFLRQYDTAWTTATPTPVPPDRAYDAVAQHLAYCLVTDPDTTRVTQPFTLRDKPHAVLLQWKKR
ncbi:hypothetical protein EDB89DRAFT_2168748 [Lactarius sanguifluus]|nr:hypothetical protein EDB89DRAFT_2168748 [Lactarius sanguifluus]